MLISDHEAQLFNYIRIARQSVGYLINFGHKADLHETRVVSGLYTRVPPVLWGTLYFLAALAMLGVGYHAGLTGKLRSLAFLVLVLTFSAVMVPVADLDRPQEGMTRVSPRALFDVLSTMEPDAAQQSPAANDTGR